MNVGTLAQDGERLGACRILRGVALSEVLDVFLQVIELLIDLHFAARSSDDRMLEPAVERILEPVARVIDALD